MTIKIIDQNQSKLAEAKQSTKIAFALMLRDGQDRINITPMILCRDYFNDLIYAQYHKLENFTRYGFTWSYNEKLEQEIKDTRERDAAPSLSLVISVPKNNWQNVLKYWKLVKLFEDKMEFNNTIIYEDYGIDTDINKYKDTVLLLVNMPVDWLANSINMSLYTLLWRLSAYDLPLTKDMDIGTLIDTLHENFEAYENNTDKGLVESLYKYKKHLIKYVDNWRLMGANPQPIDPDTENISSYIHDGSGIISLLEGMNNPEGAEPAVKEWCKLLGAEGSKE